MAATQFDAPRGGSKANLSPTKISAGVIWTIGLIMTFAALDQAVEWNGAQVLGASILIQIALTFGQSPVWRGRGDIFSYTLLITDAVINFGGTMAIMVNIDDVGSVQAISATFANYNGEWPIWIKGLIALVAAAFVAGLPEYLWKVSD